MAFIFHMTDFYEVKKAGNRVSLRRNNKKVMCDKSVYFNVSDRMVYMQVEYYNCSHFFLLEKSLELSSSFDLYTHVWGMI